PGCLEESELAIFQFQGQAQLLADQGTFSIRLNGEVLALEQPKTYQGRIQPFGQRVVKEILQYLQLSVQVLLMSPVLPSRLRRSDFQHGLGCSAFLPGLEIPPRAWIATLDDKDVRGHPPTWVAFHIVQQQVTGHIHPLTGEPVAQPSNKVQNPIPM